MSVKFPTSAIKFHPNFSPLKNGIKQASNYMGRIVVSVEGLERLSKLGMNLAEIPSELGFKSPAANILKEQFKSYSDFAQSTSIVNRLADWVFAPPKRGTLAFGKLFFLTLGNAATTVRFLGRLNLIQLGRLSQPTFSLGCFRGLPGISLLKELPMAISSGFSIAENRKELKKLKQIKSTTYSHELRKWKAKNDLLKAVQAGNTAEILRLKEEYSLCRKELGVRVNNVRLNNLVEANPIIDSKWNQLIQLAADKNIDRSKLATWKLDVWKLEKNNHSLNRRRMIAAMIYDSFKITIIVPIVITPYLTPISAPFLLFISTSSLGLYRFLMPKPTPRPSRPIPKAAPAA